MHTFLVTGNARITIKKIRAKITHTSETVATYKT
jgi:hypothetical protein